jgi:hypothetical protein
MFDKLKAVPDLPFIASSGWIAIWWFALTRPSTSTYEKLVQSSTATVGRAFTWVFVSGLTSALIVSSGPLFARWVEKNFWGVGLLLALPLPAVLAVLYWVIFSGCTQWMAQRLGGRGTYRQLAYAFAAFSAPLMIGMSLLSLVPHSGLLLIGLYVCWLGLYVIAVQAVNQFSRARSLGVTVVSFLLLSAALLGLIVGIGFWGLRAQ